MKSTFCVPRFWTKSGEWLMCIPSWESRAEVSHHPPQLPAGWTSFCASSVGVDWEGVPPDSSIWAIKIITLVCINGIVLSASNDAMVYAPASQARGPRFKSLREHSSLSLKSLEFVPVPFRSSLWMGQARIENNLFIYYVSCSKKMLLFMRAFEWYGIECRIPDNSTPNL